MELDSIMSNTNLKMNKNGQNILLEPIVGKASSRLVASSAHARYHALCERAWPTQSSWAMGREMRGVPVYFDLNCNLSRVTILLGTQQVVFSP